MSAAATTVVVRLPRALLQYWSGPPMLELEGRTLGETMVHLEAHAPGLVGRILDDQGRIRPHVAVFINDRLVEGREPSTVRLRPGDQVRIVPAVSGG